MHRCSGWNRRKVPVESSGHPPLIPGWTYSVCLHRFFENLAGTLPSGAGCHWNGKKKSRLEKFGDQLPRRCVPISESAPIFLFTTWSSPLHRWSGTWFPRRSLSWSRGFQGCREVWKSETNRAFFYQKHPNSAWFSVNLPGNTIRNVRWPVKRDGFPKIVHSG